jgi:hypothetical protein
VVAPHFLKEVEMQQDKKRCMPTSTTETDHKHKQKMDLLQLMQQTPIPHLANYLCPISHSHPATPIATTEWVYFHTTNVECTIAIIIQTHWCLMQPSQPFNSQQQIGLSTATTAVITTVGPMPMTPMPMIRSAVCIEFAWSSYLSVVRARACAVPVVNILPTRRLRS